MNFSVRLEEKWLYAFHAVVDRSPQINQTKPSNNRCMFAYIDLIATWLANEMKNALWVEKENTTFTSAVRKISEKKIV